MVAAASRRRVVAVAVVLTVCAAVLGAMSGLPPALAAPPQQQADAVFKVTLAARSCDDYADVMANRARNDIQESLKDPGKNTVYSAGQPISPAIEEPNNPACEPIDGWRFALGDSYTKPAPVGSNQSLTIVRTNVAQTGTTATVPELDEQGNDTGRSLDGAVTVTLTAQQAARAASNSLWVQGGTPSDPQQDNEFGPRYAFAALRCAVDNLNGDNVEWVGFPNTASGVKSHHVFCWAYYVSPRPGFGSVTIRKVVTPNTAAGTTFRFASDLTYDPSGTFTLTARGGQSGSFSFDRAESSSFGDPYLTREQVPPGWRLANRGCTSATGDSSFTYPGTTGVSVDLAAGDNVEWVGFPNTPLARPGLRVSKTTTDGVGGPFPFAISGPGGLSRAATVTTTDEGVPTEAFAQDSGLDPGTYRIEETLPDPTASGRWEFVQASCAQTRAR